MSPPDSPKTVTDGQVSRDDIASFLQANPSFFDDHPALLRDLVIPHDSGDAVSLLERQANLLREENDRIKRQFNELIRLATENERLNRKIHELAVALVDAPGPQAIFRVLESRLTEDFDAHRVGALVFAEPAFVDSGELSQFVGAKADFRQHFAQALGGGKAVCGNLPAEQRSALFGAGEFPGSAVIMPLLGKQWQGVLVIASNDPRRFEPGMSTDFLDYLRDVVTLVVDPWVKRAAA